MELFLLHLNAFLRPILSMDLSFGGSKDAVMEVFNWVAILLFVVLGLAFMVNAAMRKQIRFTEIDLVIGAFVVWCVAVYLIYIDKAIGREMIKLVFPLFVYFVAKNILTNAEQYRRMLGIMIAAFTIPVIVSTSLIALGKGVEGINYWTNIPRYEGVYNGAHNLGHNMVLLLMMIVVYVTVRPQAGDEEVQVVRPTHKFYFAAMAVSAFYCLVMSQTRTQLLGAITFFGYYLFAFHRRIFYIASVVAIVLFISFLPFLMSTLLQDFGKVSSGAWGEEEIASGRPRIWENNLTIFWNMPIDRQIAGIGIGNKDIFGGVEGTSDSHNDFLDVMIQTGIVGLVLYLTILLLMLRKIRQLSGREKHVFLGVFMAVVLMNFASNSYITRSALAQTLFLMMTFVELPRPVKPQDNQGRVLSTGK